MGVGHIPEDENGRDYERELNSGSRSISFAAIFLMLPQLVYSHTKHGYTNESRHSKHPDAREGSQKQAGKMAGH